MHREIGGDDYDKNALHCGADGVRKNNLPTIIIVHYDFSIRGKKKHYQ